MVRANGGADAVVDQIVSLYEELIAENRSSGKPNLDEEARCSAAYLRWLEPTVRDQQEHVKSLVEWAVERQGAVESLATELAEKHERVLALVDRVAERQRAVDSTATELEESQNRVVSLTARVTAQDAELRKIRSTLGWRLLSGYGKIKYRYLLPIYRLLNLNRRSKDEPA